MISPIKQLINYVITWWHLAGYADGRVFWLPQLKGDRVDRIEWNSLHCERLQTTSTYKRLYYLNKIYTFVYSVLYASCEYEYVQLQYMYWFYVLQQFGNSWLYI